jgi:hypothetical protein
VIWEISLPTSKVCFFCGASVFLFGVTAGEDSSNLDKTPLIYSSLSSSVYSSLSSGELAQIFCIEKKSGIIKNKKGLKTNFFLILSFLF